mgnify:CR=1 FL=1
MQDMMKMYAMNGMGGMDMNMFAADQTLTLNANNELVKYIFEHKDSEKRSDVLRAVIRSGCALQPSVICR